MLKSLHGSILLNRLSGENQKPLCNACEGMLAVLQTKTLGDVRRQIMLGAVKRNRPLPIDHQKTTGIHFCQLSACIGWIVDKARVIVFSPLWQRYPNLLRLPLERADRKGYEDPVVYHQADDLNLHGRR
jgi:hypothetical protein